MTDQSGRQRAALAISRIGVRRIEGIDTPYQIDGLSPGINLIYGPNAIGKSRTATAMHALIWPEAASSHTDLIGSLQLGNELVRVAVDGGRARYEGRNGAGSGTHVPASQRDRYLLTLHQLLRDNNHRFAEMIQREAAGGYDLKAVRQTMKAVSKPKPRSRKAADGVGEGSAKVKALQAEYGALYRKEQSLTDAHQRLADAREAAKRVPLLRAALDYLNAEDELREAKVVRASFEDPIGNMNGEEPVQIRKLEDRRAELIDRRVRLEHELSSIAARLRATGFGAELPAGHVLPELRERLSRVNSLDSDLRGARLQIQRDMTRADTCRDRTAAGITGQQLEALDAKGLRELASLSREYRDLLAEERAEAALEEWLGGVEAPENLLQLRGATDLLARRIQLGDGISLATVGLVKLMLLGASVLIVALAAVLAIEVAPAWLLAAISAVPVALVVFKPSVPANHVETDDIRRQLEDLGVGQPSSWELPDVVAMLDTVHRARANAEVEHLKSLRWGSLAGRRQHLAAKRQEVETKRQHLIKAFGIAPADASADSLRLIADALDSWRQASDAVAAGRKAEAELLRERDALRDTINGQLGIFDAGPVQDGAAAHAVVEELAARLDRARELQALSENQRRTLDEQVLPSIVAIERDLAETWSRYGLEEGDIVGLTRLCERVQPCREAQRRLETAQAMIHARRESLVDAPELLARTREDLQDALTQAKALSDGRDAVQREISDIDASVEQARSQTRLEEAIARVDVEVEALRQTRESDYRDAAGWCVSEFIQNRNRTENRPAVFREADSLLLRFTSGAFRLELDEGTKSEFRAIETSTGSALDLEELSSGTRVQLLMAIRLAFVEAAEQGPKLPLILDEALGNTDDSRANAIIDAAIEIAHGGRQVFYFTAQQDEVAKWEARISSHPDIPPCTTHDLGAIRGRAAARRRRSARWTPPTAPIVVLPDDMDYDAAREALDVAPVDLWASHIDGVDLYYVFPNVQLLATLRSRSLLTWGQYRYLTENGRYALPVDEALHRRAMVRARVIDEVRIGWQVGRPRPVSAQVLRECGLVTDAFIRQVVALCKELDGNCVDLLDALRRRRVSGFRARTIEELDDYFRHEGFLTDMQPLPDEIIRARAFAVASDSLDSGLLSEAEIDMLLGSLTGVDVAVIAVAD